MKEGNRCVSASPLWSSDHDQKHLPVPGPHLCPPELHAAFYLVSVLLRLTSPAVFSVRVAPSFTALAETPGLQAEEVGLTWGCFRRAFCGPERRLREQYRRRKGSGGSGYRSASHGP